jgi:hypothetical protein
LLKKAINGIKKSTEELRRAFRDLSLLKTTFLAKAANENRSFFFGA